MKKNRFPQIPKIEKINLLLRKFVTTDLSDSESDQLEIQSKESEKLGHLQSLFAKITASANGDNEKQLKVNPMIKNSIRKKMKTRAAMQRDSSNSSLFSFFQIRVPLYQAAIAVFAIMSLFVTINQPRSKKDVSTIALGQASQVERSIVDSLRIMQNLHLMENQKVGRNIQEDSLLIRFIMTSVDLF